MACVRTVAGGATRGAILDVRAASSDCDPVLARDFKVSPDAFLVL